MPLRLVMAARETPHTTRPSVTNQIVKRVVFGCKLLMGVNEVHVYAPRI
jgi:hypothetical protein